MYSIVLLDYYLGKVLVVNFAPHIYNSEDELENLLSKYVEEFKDHGEDIYYLVVEGLVDIETRNINEIKS